jgi:hypothetical protein
MRSGAYGILEPNPDLPSMDLGQVWGRLLWPLAAPCQGRKNWNYF